MSGLRIAADLSLPVDVVTQAIGILARRGAGKTYTATVLVEEAVKARQPVVVLDPTGAWWGLRSSADGTAPGLPVVILGGEHGDVPLQATAGKVIADVVVDHPGAFVVDLSGFESNAAQERFATDFLERLYRAKATRREPLLLVVDEADSFAPQRAMPGQTRTLGAMEAIVRRGRIRGLGVVLISQRAAVLNKNVLTQIEVLIALQTTSPQDRTAIDEWVKANASPDERAQVMGSLASLAQGEAWVWSPSWLRILQRVRIRTRETFDSSATPKAGERRIEPREFATVDLGKLGAQIAASVERVKANDPETLRARIRELERGGAARPDATPPTPVVQRVEVPVLTADMVGRLFVEVDRLRVFGAGLVQIADQITAAVGRANQVPIAGQVKRAPSAPSQPTAMLVPAREPIPENGEARLGRAERTLLAALAQHPQGLSRVQLSLLSGYSIKSSSFGNAIGALRANGLASRGPEPIRATPEGMGFAGDVPPLPVPGPELVAYWAGQLGRAERAFLEAFVAAYPGELGRDDLAERTGYSATSSSFGNALGHLRSLQLISGWRASDDLMGSGR